MIPDQSTQRGSSKVREWCRPKPRQGPAAQEHASISPLQVVSDDFLEDCLGPPLQGPFRSDAALAVDEQLLRVVALEGKLRLQQAHLFASLQDCRGWIALGFVRLGDYTGERLGLHPRSLQEDSRLARELRSLPILRRAFDQRVITWTHVRLLVPLLETVPLEERAFTERRWVEIARQSSTRELGKLIALAVSEQQSRRAETEVNSEPEPSVTAAGGGVPGARQTGSTRCEHSEPRDADTTTECECVRWTIRLRRPALRLWRAVRETAERSTGSRCTNEQVLELVAAEVASGAPLVADSAEGPETHDGDGENWAARASREEPRAWVSGQARDQAHIERFGAWVGATEGFDWLPRRESIAAPGEATDFVNGLKRGASMFPGAAKLDPFQLDEQLRQVGRAMQRIDFQLGTLLRTLSDRRLHHELGFATFKLYCESRLGISSSKASALVSLERGSWQNLPALREAYRDGRLSFLKAATLLPVLSEYYGELWIERACEVTLQRLTDEVALAVDCLDEPCSRPQAPLPAGTDVRGELAQRLDQLRVQMRALPKDRRSREHEQLSARLAVKSSPEVALLMEDTLLRVRRPGEARGLTFERMLAHVLDVWTDVPRHRDPVFEREGWRCAVPGCSSRSALHDHHVKFRSRGGSNRLENRVAVCVWHHQLGIHGDGSVVVHGYAPDRLFWQLGCKAGRQPLLRLEGDRYVN